MKGRLIAGVILAYLVVGISYAVTTPVFEASDELWHYPVIQHLANGGELPILDPEDPGPWRQEAGQPPLYYVIMAVATGWIDTSDMTTVRWLNPHVDAGVVTPDGNINLAIHTQAERFPWGGTVLAVRIIRILSVLMGAGTVYLTYRIALEMRPRWRYIAAGAAGVVAFTPMFAFISGAVNNDNLAMLLASCTVFVVARMGVHGDTGKKYRFALNWEWNRVRGHVSITHVLLGALIGLGALTKLSCLTLLPIAAAIVAYNESARWWFDPNRTRIHVLAMHVLVLVLQLGVIFGIAALISGWWYVRNLQLYGTLLGTDAFIAVLGRRAHPASLTQLWSERGGFLQSYWGLFGAVNLPMPDWVYNILNTLVVLSVVGLFIFIFRKWLDDRWTIRRWLPLGTVSVFTIAIIFSLVRWATDTWSSQGRLVFTAIQSISVLFTFGIISLVPRRYPEWRHRLIAVVVVFLFVITLGVPSTVIAPMYADPPPADLSAMAQASEIEFVSRLQPPQMRLLGYTIDNYAVHPGGDVVITMYWQALRAMDTDWSIFLHLVDQDHIVVAQRDSYLGLGVLPTSRMQPEQTVADRYVVPIPATAYAPSKLQVVVGLYDYVVEERLLTSRGEDSAKLGVILLEELPGDLPNRQSVNFQGQIEFVGYELDTRILPPGEDLLLTLYWKGQRRLNTNYSVFAHVRGVGEELWGQHDSWPANGEAPTSTWIAREIVKDEHMITVDPYTPAGTYVIEIGAYDASGRRLQRINSNGRWTDNFLNLSQIRVVEY